jgi:hypothetical protein
MEAQSNDVESDKAEAVGSLWRGRKGAAMVVVEFSMIVSRWWWWRWWEYGAHGRKKERCKADARGINRGRQNYCDGNDATRGSL